MIVSLSYTGSMFRRPLTLILLCVFGPSFGQKYEGPRPPKPDAPYLLHASNLVETEAGEAKEEKRKDGMAYVIAGASSPARTPMAEPIWLVAAEKLAVQKLQLYKLEVKGGQREVFFPQKKRKDGPRPLYLTFKQLAPGLYRLEASETLEIGEYSLTPEGANQVFCFQVY